MSSLLFRTWQVGAPAPEELPAWSASARGTVRGWSFALLKNAPAPHVNEQRLEQIEISVHVDRDAGNVRLRRPLTAIQSLFFRRSPSGVAVSDDPGLIRAVGDEPDPKALAALLVFGTLIAPASPWTGVTQVRPGTEIVLDFTGIQARESALPLWEPRLLSAEAGPGAAGCQETRDLLVSVVGELARGVEPLTLFSGGVDSSLIALAARDLGFNSTPLLHCSMGPADPETGHARRVADALKLPIEIVTFRPAETLASFPALLRDYPVPFSDYSILPTWFLSNEALRRLQPGAIALDGTGADAAFGQFGSFRKWSHFYRVPQFLRETGAWLYRALRCYLQEGHLDRWLRKPQRTRSYRPEVANLVVHPMEGIGLHVPREVLDGLEQDLLSWAGRVLAVGEEARFCLIDIVHQCRGVLAQKDAPVFNRVGRTAGYPYLHPSVLRLAMEDVRHWPGQLEPKAILKKVLAAEIGPDLVYRPKSGFVLPQVETFGHPIVLGLLEEVLETRSGLLADWVDRSVLSSLLEVLRTKKRLALYSYSYIWAVIVAHHWYGISGKSPKRAS